MKRCPFCDSTRLDKFLYGLSSVSAVPAFHCRKCGRHFIAKVEEITPHICFNCKKPIYQVPVPMGNGKSKHYRCKRAIASKSENERAA
jgi:transposase-like protein